MPVSGSVVDLADTIVALATPNFGAACAVVRLSGSISWQLARRVFRPGLPKAETDLAPLAVQGELDLELPATVPATLYLSRSPRSYTGEDLVEIHTIGSQPLLEHLQSLLVTGGARLAQPGEFTLRAFLAGKLDLTAAEAVHGLISAANPRQAEVALRQMAGGICQPIHLLQEQLLDLVAEVEASLDFGEEEDLEFVDRSTANRWLESVAEQLEELESQMQSRSLHNERVRVVLVGRPNAGKSTLFNALLGHSAAIVSPIAGTTRDYLQSRMTLRNAEVDVIDTAGHVDPEDELEHLAQCQRNTMAEAADLLIWCSDGTDGPADRIPELGSWGSRKGIFVRTKIDLHTPELASSETLVTSMEKSSVQPRAWRAFVVSAQTGKGIKELRDGIEELLSSAMEVEVVPTTAVRCQHSISAAMCAIKRARSLLVSGTNELIAFELRLALEELGQIVGAVYTDDVLDRIFSRFCIGK